MFSHTQLGDTLTELVPGSAAEHVRQAVVTVATEQIEPQRPFYEILSELDTGNAISGGDNTGGGDSGNGPVVPGGTTTVPGGEEVTE